MAYVIKKYYICLSILFCVVMDDLKELLAKECNCRFSMDSPDMEKFIASLTEVHLHSGGADLLWSAGY